MSITVSNCNQICGSPLNRSPAKALFSFGKEERFKKPKDLQGEIFYYDLPSMKMHRTCSFGFGKKLDFTKTQKRFKPGPEDYSQKQDRKSVLNNYTGGKHGVTIGFSRERCKFNGIMYDMPAMTPAPGQYKSKETKSQVKYSFGIKFDFVSAKKAKAVSPDPGSYELPPVINGKGTYLQSQFKSPGASFINPPRSKRFVVPNKQQLNMVGPGQYDISGMTKERKLLLSQNQNQLVSSFINVEKKELNTSFFAPGINKLFQFLGPGQYQMPSEFGIYESAKKGSISLHK